MIERIDLNFDKYVNIKTLFKYFKINQKEIIGIKGFITIVVLWYFGILTQYVL